jgi:hypothetical protein
LLAILSETESPDAFVVALGLLLEEKVEARRVIPAIIRNAERVGILGATASTRGPKADRAQFVVEAVRALSERRGGHRKAEEKADPSYSAPSTMPAEDTEQPNDHPIESILPPIREGSALPTCEAPPDEACVLRALPQLTTGVPFIYAEHRDNVRIVTELLVDKIDEPRFYPLVGPAQLHRCHWKCTVYYDEIIESSYPFPFRCVRPRVQVLYIDRDHLHLHEARGPEASSPSTAAQAGGDDASAEQTAKVIEKLAILQARLAAESVWRAWIAGLFGEPGPRDPSASIEQLLNNSENLPTIEEWQHIWFDDQPSHLTYERVHGGIQ